MYLVGAQGAFFILWTFWLLLTCKWTRGERLEYEPLRCFGCSEDGSFLCKGDEFQHGRSVNCPHYNTRSSIDSKNLTTRIYDVPNHNLTVGKYMKDEELNVSNPITLRNYNGKLIQVINAYRCWIMKVEYRSNGRIEIYKGCERDAGEDFARYSAFQGYPTVRDLRVGCKKLEPVFLGPSHPAEVTVCFCDTPYCNNGTITHTERNLEVGLEDIEQRKRLKNKSRAETIHQRTRTWINGPLILVLALTISFAPNNI